MSGYALVGSVGTVTTGASGAAVTPAYPQTPTAGSRLGLLVRGDGTATLPSAPAGWSLEKQIGATNCSASIFHKRAAGGDSAPTVALVASTILSAQLVEFSGGDTSASPVDHSNSGSAAATTGPLVVALGSADALAGELVLMVAAWHRSVAATNSLAHALTVSGGAQTVHETLSSGSSTGHYDFAWAITTANSAADSDSVSWSGSSNVALVVVSFKLASLLSGQAHSRRAAVRPRAPARGRF